MRIELLLLHTGTLVWGGWVCGERQLRRGQNLGVTLSWMQAVRNWLIQLKQKMQVMLVRRHHGLHLCCTAPAVHGHVGMEASQHLSPTCAYSGG